MFKGLKLPHIWGQLIKNMWLDPGYNSFLVIYISFCLNILEVFTYLTTLRDY